MPKFALILVPAALALAVAGCHVNSDALIER